VAGLLALLGGVLRLAAGLLAFVLMLGALLVGAALALGLVAWALLRGRRPGARVFGSGFQRVRPGPAGAAGGRATRPPGAVIDGEGREVPEHPDHGQTPAHTPLHPPV
jgi:hypothetical protein